MPDMPSNHGHRIRAAAMFVVMACNIAPALAAKPVLRAILQSDTVYVGQRFTVTVLVESEDAPGQPDLSQMGDFHASGLISGPAVDPKTGARSYQYHLVAAQAGERTVCPIYVPIGGRRLTVPSVAVRVLSPEQSPDSQISVKLSASRCFVSQPVRLTVVWRLAIPFGAVKAVDLRLPVMRDPRFSVVDIHTPPDVDRSGDIGMPVSDTRIIARAGSEETDGRKFSTLTFEKIIIPQKSGLIEIAPSSVLCAVLPTEGKSRGAWNRYVSYFDNEFFNKDIPPGQRRIFAWSEPIALKVDPLPTTGRPDNYSAIVGRCGLSVSANPKSVVAGGPVTLTIRVSGLEFPETVKLPPLIGQKALAIAFAIPAERAAGRIVDRSAVFTQTVRPLRDSVSEIPSIELDYLDPETGKYASVRSEAIPISVSQAPATSPGGAPESFDTGLRHNYYGSELLIDQSSLPTPGGPLVSMAVLICPPGLFVVVTATLFLRRRRLAASVSIGARSAARTLRKQLAEIKRCDESDALEAMDIAVRTCLEHADIGLDVRSELESVVAACQAQRFGRAECDVENLIDRVEEALK